MAGFLISALGGSRFQIGGPAGAFIVLVAATIERHGYDGLALATVMAGLILMAIGFLRLGTYIKYIPHPVTIGFTAGIAVIIFASQLRELLGLTLPGKEPGPLIPKLAAFWQAANTVNPAAVGVAAITIGVILGLRRYRPGWPGFSDRRRGRGGADGCVAPARRDHRNALRRLAALAAEPPLAGRFA